MNSTSTTGVLFLILLTLPFSSLASDESWSWDDELSVSLGSSLGWVPLQGNEVDSGLLNAANGQLSATLVALGNSGVVALDTPARRAVDELERLRSAGRSAFVSWVVTGEVVGTDGSGIVRIIVFSVDGEETTEITEEFTSTTQEEIQSAVEAAACRGLASLHSHDCVGRIAVESFPANTELLVDGVSASPIIDAGDVDAAGMEDFGAPETAAALENPTTFHVPIGSRRVRLVQGDRESAERRVFVHLEGTTRLRLAEGCGQLYVLAPGEEVGCTDVLPLVLVSPHEPISTTRWVAIASAGTGAALLVSGVLFGIHARSVEQRLSTGYDSGGLPRDQVARDLAGMRTSAFAANVQLIAGGLALATGGALLAWPW